MTTASKQCCLPSFLLILKFTVPQQHLPLELGHVLVPKLGGLAVQGARTIAKLRQKPPPKPPSDWRDIQNSLVRLAQQALQAQQHALHVEHGAPLVLEDVEADAA